MIERVVFDLDGVLLDSEQVWNEVREGLARERGGRWSERAQTNMIEGPRDVYPPASSPTGRGRAFAKLAEMASEREL